MGVFGTIMKFVMIVFVIVLVIAIVLFGIMFLFPSVTILGYHFVSSNGKEYNTSFVRDDTNETVWDGADIIRVETFGYDVTVRTVGTHETWGDRYTAIVEGSFRGFVKGEIKRPTFSYTQDASGYVIEEGKKIFTIKIAEPEKGFLLRGGTKLTLVVPDNAFQNKDLEIITNYGTVNFGGDQDMSSENLATKNLTIKSTSGKVNLNEMSNSQNLNVIKTKGDVYSKNDLNGNVNIEILGGKGVVELKNVGQEGTITSKLSAKTTNSHFTVNNVYGGFEYEAGGGLLEVTKVFDYADVKLASCDCRIGEILNGLSVNGKDGSVKTEAVHGTVTSDMTTGSLYIGESFAAVNAQSTKGSITIKKPHTNVVLTSAGGNLNVECMPETKIDMNIENTGGKVTFKDAKGVVKINETLQNSSCSVTGNFLNDMSGESIINTKSGSVSLTVPQKSSLIVSWATLSGKVDVSVGSFVTNQKTTYAYNGNPTDTEYTYVNILTKQMAKQDTSTDRISVSSNSGKITFRAISA